MKDMKDIKRENLKTAIKTIIGAQLIAENAENLIESKLVSKDSKYKLRALNGHAERFINEYWKQMDQDKTESAEISYQNIMRKIEDLIESVF